MLAQRATQQSLRRLATAKPSMISQMAMGRFAAPAAAMQTRLVATTPIKPADSYEILVAQRKLRPVAPHLTIYKPQIPWVLSGLNRITGVTVSGVFYLFGAAYLVSPVLGWHLDSATLAASFAAWPLVLKLAAKTALALPFTFHSINGLRHLMWDFAFNFKNKNVISTGWTVVGLTFASTIALVAFV